MGSYSSVASLPAYLRMIFGPPGCSVEKVRYKQANCANSCEMYLIEILLRHMLCHVQSPNTILSNYA